ncbi:MAG TPA: xanthine dehydrogenase family protein molybdopterin-binding subunit [Gemmatimonadales bacterium]|nr:xanthine dehydrogenase family protein molybdopterin-binding subunit [Gemmatimonadales bacterium]
MSPVVSRREFLKTGAATGAGLVIAVQLQGCAKQAPPASTAPFAPNAWVRVQDDGSVLIEVDRSEMGQGVSTALPMLVAEELEADWSSVRYEAAPANPAYGNKLTRGMQVTGGSTAVPNGWVPLRQAGAQAREMLLSAAAARWGVDRATCHAENSRVLHEASGRSATYGELATAAAKLPVPETVRLKDPKDWKLIGRPVPRLDVPAVVRGEPVFAGDVRVPGMLVAQVERPPVLGGSVKSFDDAEARAVPGVRAVVQLSGGVAVIAEDFWAARKGREALVVEWDEGPNTALDSDAVRATLRALVAQPKGAVVRQDGDAPGTIASLTRKLRVEYEAPYLAHATMEPMTCSADVRPDGVTLWAPTQMQWGPKTFGGGAQGTAATIAGVDMERVDVRTTKLGGGFGRRSEMDFIADAVEASKAIGAPVRVVWTREDDMRHDFYRPVTLHVFEGAVDEAGRPVAWSHVIAGPSIMARYLPSWMPEFAANKMGMLKHGADPTSVEGAENIPYGIANVRVDYRRAEIPVPVGFWRSVGSSQNAFATEGFIDELADLAGQDPVAFRRALLADKPRHRAVLDLAAEKAGWGTPLPPGRARGVAVAESFGSFVAEVAEVSVTNGVVRVHRVTCAIDCGQVVNPDIVTAQMEGAIAYGLTAALKGEITIEKGRVKQSNFLDYPLLRIDEMPEIAVHLVPSTENPGGVGEPGTPPIAPAVANAVSALTGTRVRRLPIRLSS